MTTIACNRELMAADSQVTRGTISAACQKIWKVNGDILGTCGTYEIGLQFVKWYEAKGAAPELWDSSAEDFTALVLTAKGGIFEYGPKLMPIEVMEKFHAVGSGCEIAIGAMEAGADPIQAVKIACKRDSGSGGKVRHMGVK